MLNVFIFDISNHKHTKYTNMKNVIISITEFLATVLPYAIAEMIVENIMEYGCIEGLETDLFDELVGYFPDHVAIQLARQAMTSF